MNNWQSKGLVDAHIRIDVGGYYNKNTELGIKILECAAKDILSFLRDHRSMDINDAYVVREYMWICIFCGWVEEEQGEPACCEKAVEEWEKHLVKSNQKD